MDYITTTQLRTQTSKLVKALEKGESVTCIHRSKVIGVFEPVEKDANITGVDKRNKRKK